MNEVQLIASEVATFYHSLVDNDIDAFTAASLTSTFIATRLQYGKFPDESPIIPFPLGEQPDDEH